MRLEGKVAIITGASNGIGKAAANLFAKAGAKLVLTDIDDDSGETLSAELNASGGNTIYLHTNITDLGDVERSVALAQEKFGRLDVLYNNAGGSRNDGQLHQVALEDFWDTMSLNVLGSWLCCRAALPALIASGGGSIVNTTSILAATGWPNKDAYTASKGAISALTRSMAVEYASQGIRVNAVAPGITMSERAAKLLAGPGNHGPAAMVNRHILGLLAPEQIGEAALFLASDASSGMTGQIITVDSGYSAA